MNTTSANPGLAPNSHHRPEALGYGLHIADPDSSETKASRLSRPVR
jgi:hypothetical protein